MAQFTVNTQRFDPYKNFKFQVFFGNNTQAVAGVSKVSMLKRTTEVIKHREGGDSGSSRKSPGRTEYEAITLERGVTHDQEFEIWARKCENTSANRGLWVSNDCKKDITISIYNEAGQVAISYLVSRCWVSEYQAIADLDANGNAILIQHIKLENEGWRRDDSISEPKQPTFG